MKEANNTYTFDEVYYALKPYFVSATHDKIVLEVVSTSVVRMLPTLIEEQRKKTKEQEVIQEVDKIETVSDIYAEIYTILKKADINWLTLAKSNKIYAVIRVDAHKDHKINRTAIIDSTVKEFKGLHFMNICQEYIDIANIDIYTAKETLKYVKEYTR